MQIRPLLLPLAITLFGTIDTAAAVDPATPPPSPTPAAAYPGDRIGVPAYGNGCPAIRLSTTVAPELRQVQFVANGAGADDDVYVYELVYQATRNASDPCGTPPPRDYAQLIDVGVLPRGLHRFNVVGFANGVEFVRYTTPDAWVTVHERPGNEISGAWYAPDQDGRGVFVMRNTALTAIYWANHDETGRASWVLLTQTGFSNNVIAGNAVTTTGVPLAPGPATSQQVPWGSLTFTYVGCGRATLAWNANDARITDGSIELRQLMQPDGIGVCDITSRVAGLPAVRIGLP